MSHGHSVKNTGLIGHSKLMCVVPRQSQALHHIRITLETVLNE